MLPIPDSIQIRLVLVLVHFLWQGALVAALLAGIVSIVRVCSLRAKYAASLFSLLLMAACPVVTWCWLPCVEVDANSGFTALPARLNDTPSFPARASSALGAADSDADRRESSGPERETGGFGGRAVRAALLAPKNDRTGPSKPTGEATDRSRLQGGRNDVPSQSASTAAETVWWQPAAPWIVVLWLMGVAILSLRLLIGTVETWRWRRQLEPLPQSLVMMVNQLCGLLGMRIPRVALSSRVTEAVATGLFRPLILMPVWWATSIPSDMIEGVLAHELAHIRRHDLWVNLFQRVVETLFFYHPAVWWLSNRLRTERELCCDDLAVSVTRDRVRFAEMLEYVGRMRLSTSLTPVALSIANPRHALLERVRHVLQPGSTDDARGSSLIAALLLMLAVLSGVMLTSRTMPPTDDWSWKKMSQDAIGDGRHHAVLLHNGKKPAFVVVRLDPPGTESSSDGLQNTMNKRGGSFTQKNFNISFEATRNGQPLETVTINGRSFSLDKGRLLVMGDQYEVTQLPDDHPEMVSAENLKVLVEDAVARAMTLVQEGGPETSTTAVAPKAVPRAKVANNVVAATQTYRGRVVTEDGSPLPAQLTLMRRVSSERTHKTTVNAKGEFTFNTDPKHGSVRFSMTVAGFAPFDSNWIKLDQPLTLTLSRGAMVRLRLVPPAEGAVVRGTAALTVPWWDEDEQGTFPVVPDGTVTIAHCPKTTVKIDLLVPGYEELRVHRLVHGDVTLDVPLVPAKPTRLRVVSAKDGRPIEGARVRLFGRTRAGSFLTPFQFWNVGPVWGQSNADGRVELTTLRALDPVPTNDPGPAVYAFRIDAPNHAPGYIGDVRAGVDLGEIQVGDALEVRGEVVRDAAAPERISLQFRQPTVAQGGRDGQGVWKNIEPTVVAGKLTFHITGLKTGPFDMFIVYSNASEPENSGRGTIKQLQFHGLLTGSSSHLVITRESVTPGDTYVTPRRASLFPVEEHPPSNVPKDAVAQLIGESHVSVRDEGNLVVEQTRPILSPLVVWSSTAPVQHSMGRVGWRVFILQDGTIFIPGNSNYEAGTHHKLSAVELQELRILLEQHRDLFGRQIPKELPEFAGWRHGHESLSYTKDGETKSFDKWYVFDQPPVAGQFDPTQAYEAITEFISRLMTDAACGGREAKAKYRDLANKTLVAALPQATPFTEATWTHSLNETDGTRVVRFADTNEKTEVTVVHPAFGDAYVSRIEQFDKRIAFDPQHVAETGVAEKRWDDVARAALLKQLRVRDAQFESRAIEVEQRSVERVSPQNEINQQAFYDLKFGQKTISPVGENDPVPEDYDQPHRRRMLLVVREPDVTFDSLGDLELPKQEKFGWRTSSGLRWSTVGGEERSWQPNFGLPDPNQRHGNGKPSLDGVLRSYQRRIEWCCGYGIAKWMKSIDRVRVKGGRRVAEGKISVLGYDTSSFELELDEDLIARRILITVPARNGNGFVKYTVETQGTVRLETAPPVAESGRYRYSRNPDGKPEIVDDDCNMYFIASSARLSGDEYKTQTQIPPKGPVETPVIERSEGRRVETSNVKAKKRTGD